MKNYKILIVLVIGIVLGIIFWYMSNEINDLKYELLSKEKVISEQDNKIKENLSELLILNTDLSSKETIIISLEEKIKSSEENCQSLVNNLKMLSDITLVPEYSTTNVIVEKKEQGVKIVDDETGKKYIQLRNSIYANYR